MNYKEFVASKLPERYESGLHVLNLYHSVLGIVSEIGELKRAIANGDLPNIKEELGDTVFYVQLELPKLVTAYGYSFPENEETPDEIMVLMDCWVADLADAAKKTLCGRDTGVMPYLYLEKILQNVVVLATYYGITLEEIVATNRVKLDNRHPGRYTADTCNNRDTEHERKILEQDNFQQEGE